MKMFARPTPADTLPVDAVLAAPFASEVDCADGWVSFQVDGADHAAFAIHADTGAQKALTPSST
jgi:hypothetical protein